MATNSADLKSPFDAEELLRMLNDGRLRDAARKGYVAQADADGRMRFVHWSKSETIADMAGVHGPGRGRLRNRSYTQKPEWNTDELTPIVKRSPQARLESLVSKVVGDALATGTLPGLDDDAVKAIVGETWKSGKPFTAEDIRRICAHYLQKNENIQKAKNFKKVVTEVPK